MAYIALGTYGLSVGGPGRYVAVGTYGLCVWGPGRHVAVGTGLLPGPVVEVGRRVVVEQHAGAVLVHVRRPVHDLTLVLVILRISDPRLIHQQLQVRNLSSKQTTIKVCSHMQKQIHVNSYQVKANSTLRFFSLLLTLRTWTKNTRSQKKYGAA